MLLRTVQLPTKMATCVCNQMTPVDIATNYMFSAMGCALCQP